MLGPDLSNWTSPAPAAVGLGLSGVLLGVLWLALHRASTLHWLVSLLLRLVVGMGALWCGMGGLSRLVVLGTSWPLWVWALIGALTLELVLWLSAFERSAVGPRLGRRLLCLRLGAFAMVLWVLLEPLWATYGERQIDKTVVVLLDDSESMHLQDDGWSASERLDIAELFDPRAVAERPGHAIRLRRIRRAREGIETGLKAGDAGDTRHWIRELIESNLLPVADRPAASAALENPAELDALRLRLSVLLEELPREVEAADSAWLARQSESRRGRIDEAAGHTRAEIAQQLLLSGPRPLLDQLDETYQLELFRVAVAPRPLTASQLQRGGAMPGDPPDRGGTDLTTALRHVLRTVPAEQLGGLLVLSDGRHNGDDAVALPGAQLAGRGVPVHSVLLGTRLGLRDASIARVESPETVFLEEEMVMQAELSFSGLRGESARVELLFGEEVVEQRVLPVADQRERQNITFTHKPETEGVVEYTLRIAELEGERFAENNERRFEVAVSDDRTNVLLVDAKPRWEFRYLRNLFYGRDAAIHLQYVLLDPDHITGEARTEPVHASADREYGAAEATALPASRAEWLKFDAIILGDIPPEALDPETIDTLLHAVNKRGAMLVISCGQNHMPHAQTSKAFRDALPVRITDGLRTVVAPEPGFRIALTATGRLHPVMSQSAEPGENERIWAKQPPLFWRHPALQARADAEILAYAERADPVTGHRLDPSLEGKGINMNKLRRARQQIQPLIVARRAGRGHVLVVATDQTWRLRYKAGDVYHHRFWGQLLQWGAGERLRAGNEQIRLGTDKLVYGPDESVRVQAKIIEDSLLPGPGEMLEVHIAREDEVLPFFKQPMRYRENSAGMFEALLPPFEPSGRYRVRLSSPAEAAPVETSFTVAGGRMSLELSELSADPATLQGLADLSGGRVFGTDDMLDAEELFGSANEIIPERRDTTLWDRWPVFLAFLALLTAEWISRRSASLP